MLSRPRPNLEEEVIPPKKEPPKVVFDTSNIEGENVNSSKFDNSKNKMSMGFKNLMAEDDDGDRLKKARDLTSIYTSKKDNKSDIFNDDEDDKNER